MLKFWRLIFKVEKSASRERQFLRKPHSKYFAQFSGGFCRFWQGRRQFPWLSPKYFESGSLLRIFHVYTFFSGNQASMEKSWIYLSKMSSKTWLYKWYVFGLSISPTFSTIFSTVNPRFLHSGLISRKNALRPGGGLRRVCSRILIVEGWVKKEPIFYCFSLCISLECVAV